MHMTFKQRDPFTVWSKQANHSGKHNVVLTVAGLHIILTVAEAMTLANQLVDCAEVQLELNKEKGF